MKLQFFVIVFDNGNLIIFCRRKKYKCSVCHDYQPLKSFMGKRPQVATNIA